MDRMVGVSRPGAVATRARVFQQPSNRLVPAIPRHRDEILTAHPDLGRVGACIEEHLHCVEMPFANGEADGPRVPVSSVTQVGIAP